jgi:hypothetical protein
MANKYDWELLPSTNGRRMTALREKVKVVKDNIIEWVGIGFKLSPPFFDW